MGVGKTGILMPEEHSHRTAMILTAAVVAAEGLWHHRYTPEVPLVYMMVHTSSAEGRIGAHGLACPIATTSSQVSNLQPRLFNACECRRDANTLNVLYPTNIHCASQHSISATGKLTV